MFYIYSRSDVQYICKILLNSPQVTHKRNRYCRLTAEFCQLIQMHTSDQTGNVNAAALLHTKQTQCLSYGFIFTQQTMFSLSPFQHSNGFIRHLFLNGSHFLVPEFGNSTFENFPSGMKRTFSIHWIFILENNPCLDTDFRVTSLLTVFITSTADSII